MIRSRVLFYLMTLSAMAAFACGGEKAEPTVHTNPADTVRVMAGEQFKISLESNPSTGYSWQFTSEFDTTIIVLVGKEYVPDPNPENLVGKGGRDQWLFRGVKGGAMAVSLRYLQPWDSSSVARTVEFRIEVEGK